MKYFVIITALALSACGSSVSQGGYVSSEPPVTRSAKHVEVTPRPSPPADGQVNACTRSDCGWQAQNPGVPMK